MGTEQNRKSFRLSCNTELVFELEYKIYTKFSKAFAKYLFVLSPYIHMAHPLVAARVENVSRICENILKNFFKEQDFISYNILFQSYLEHFYQEERN